MKGTNELLFTNHQLPATIRLLAVFVIAAGSLAAVLALDRLVGLERAQLAIGAGDDLLSFAQAALCVILNLRMLRY